MFTRIYFICICVSLVNIFFVSHASAGVQTTYIPAPKIYLTGTTTDVRFDTASVLYSTELSPAHLDTQSTTLSGIFYVNNIGWATFSDGTSSVKIICPVEYQNIDSNTPACSLMGSGFSENIGSIDFGNVQYVPSTGKLGGYIRSFAGDFSVEGIMLPLHPISLNESLDNGVRANHRISLNTKNPKEYGVGVWSGVLIPSQNRLFIQSLPGKEGSYDLDMSLADTYELILEDPQGSQTHWSGLEVIPNILSQDFDTVPDTFIEKFCTITKNDDRCIERSATQLLRIGENIIADGESYYEFIFRPRDRYGNIIRSGEIDIAYTGMVSVIQLSQDIRAVQYLPGANMHDALVFEGEMFFPSYDGNWNNISPIKLMGQDIRYKISSNAPTDGSENRVVLNSIRHTEEDGSIHTFHDSKNIEFKNPYTLEITPPKTTLVGSQNTFSGYFAGTSPNKAYPDIYMMFHIGNGISSEFQDITASISSIEKSIDTDWYIDMIFPSSLLLSQIAPGTEFTFTGMYQPIGVQVDPENISYRSFVHLTSTDTFGSPIEVLYPIGTPTSTDRAEYLPSPVKIIGQNNIHSQHGSFTTNTKIRIDIFNGIRKNVAIMSRNRTDYNNVPYTVVTDKDVTIDNDFFENKQSIIVIGHDIQIASNIEKNSNIPRAIIALADREGNGGNIIIDSSVTDIYAGLFAEHSLFSSGDNQLYIYGALISGNTFGKASGARCPYYITGVCDAKKYDLEEMRSYSGGTQGLPAQGAIHYPGSALVIEYDTRIQTDPPPGLSE